MLLNNILSNDNDWTLPEPTPKKMGILFLSPEDMQEAKKSMKGKCIVTSQNSKFWNVILNK